MTDYRRALGLLDGLGPTREEGWITMNLVEMMTQGGDLTGSPLVERALGVARQVGDRILEAHCLMGLGWIELKSAKLIEARIHLGEALSVYHQAGHAWDALDTVWWLAAVAYEGGVLDMAALLLEAHATLRTERGMAPPDAADELYELERRVRGAVTPTDQAHARQQAALMSLGDTVEAAIAFTTADI